MDDPYHTVPVLLPVSLDKTLSYKVPEGVNVQPGQIVKVPLGGRQTLGVVWDGESDSEGLDPKKLKTLTVLPDMPRVPLHLRQFVDWVADWSLSSPGMVLRMVLQREEWISPPEPMPVYSLKEEGEVEGCKALRMTEARHKVLDVLRGQGALSRSKLLKQSGVSASVVEGLIKAGQVTCDLRPPKDKADVIRVDHHHVALTPDQARAVEHLQKQVRDQRFAVTLLDGVTGSGKTEVFFESVAEAVRLGLQVLILMPEIALTSQLLDRFEARFGVRPGEWHSGVTGRKRGTLWRQVAAGRAQVVIGARSALFLPFDRLGLIVVDEEHETAYKQEDRVFYNARDMAIVRGQCEDCPVILATATPSLESRYNADCGRYDHLSLPSRFNQAQLPEVQAIDLRTSPPDRGCWLAAPLVEALEETLQKGEQSLLYLNRRGYAPLTLCRACGYRFQCPDCTAWLVEHRLRGLLMCHHCGYQTPVPRACPSCGAEDKLAACGPGVERIAEEVATRFPEARLRVLSSDMQGGLARLRQDLRDIREGLVDIIIGTQLVAKGHHFPGLTLVGVVDGDIGLGPVDPRANERMFQLLGQVTGRAGRADRPGRALIQTHNPDHPVLQALLARDAQRFYVQELVQRQAGFLPPFARLASLIIAAPTQKAAFDYARAMMQALPGGRQSIDVLGPAEAPLAILRGQHRVRFLLRGPKGRSLNHFLKNWLARIRPAKGGIKLTIDMDPQSFL
jgi:primosomal protein N' (replication factor Y)